MNTNEFKYVVYRLECIKPNNKTEKVPDEVLVLNFYAKSSSKARMKTAYLSLRSPYRCKIRVNREIFINELSCTDKRRDRGYKTKRDHGI